MEIRRAACPTFNLIAVKNTGHQEVCRRSLDEKGPLDAVWFVEHLRVMRGAGGGREVIPGIWTLLKCTAFCVQYLLIIHRKLKNKGTSTLLAWVPVRPERSDNWDPLKYTDRNTAAVIGGLVVLGWPQPNSGAPETRQGASYRIRNAELRGVGATRVSGAPPSSGSTLAHFDSERTASERLPLSASGRLASHKACVLTQRQ